MCSEVDEILADITEKMKFVAMGDYENVREIIKQSQQWETKVLFPFMSFKA